MLSRRISPRLKGKGLVLSKAGGIDILVNNAGGPPPGLWSDWDREDFIRALDANMLAPIALMKASLPGMMAQGWGRVVNITSQSVKAPIPQLGLSNSARAGLTGYVAGTARQVAGLGVTINNLLPGIHATDRADALDGGVVKAEGITLDEARAKRAATIPAQRYGTIEEFGAACAFLCSVHAGFYRGSEHSAGWRGHQRDALMAKKTFSLKDQLFNARTLGQLGQEYAAGLPGFDAEAFTARALSGVEARSLLECLDWFADCLEPSLAADFPKIADQLEAMMPPPLDPTLRDDDFGQFIHAVPGVLAVRHGLEDHRERALDLLYEATQRFSMEFYIRPFLNRWPDETLARFADMGGRWELPCASAGERGDAAQTALGEEGRYRAGRDIALARSALRGRDPFCDALDRQSPQ